LLSHQNLYTFPFSPMRATCPATSHPPRLDCLNYISRKVQVLFRHFRENIAK
jgi:hypothetical protein